MNTVSGCSQLRLRRRLQRLRDHRPVELTVFDETNNHWNGGAKQILAVGDVDGGLDTTATASTTSPASPTSW